MKTEILNSLLHQERDQNLELESYGQLFYNQSQGRSIPLPGQTGWIKEWSEVLGSGVLLGVTVRPFAGLELWLHIEQGDELPLTQMSGIRLFVHDQDQPVQTENSQHITSLGFLNSFAIDYYVRQIFASC